MPSVGSGVYAVIDSDLKTAVQRKLNKERRTWRWLVTQAAKLYLSDDSLFLQEDESDG
jgi:hypothetical protein